MYCMWLLGKWSEKQVRGCGFRLRVSEWRDPEASGAWYYPGASCPTSLGQGMGTRGDWWSSRGEGGRTFKAKGQDTLCPTGSPRQDCVTQPTAPTLLPLSLNQIPLWFVLQPWTTVSLQNLSMVIRLSQDSTFALSQQALLLIYPWALFNNSLCPRNPL